MIEAVITIALSVIASLAIAYIWYHVRTVHQTTVTTETTKSDDEDIEHIEKERVSFEATVLKDVEHRKFTFEMTDGDTETVYGTYMTRGEQYRPNVHEGFNVSSSETDNIKRKIYLYEEFHDKEFVTENVRSLETTDLSYNQAPYAVTVVGTATEETNTETGETELHSFILREITDSNIIQNVNKHDDYPQIEVTDRGSSH